MLNCRSWNKPVAIFTQGLSGSGKSWWVKRLIKDAEGFEWINTDTYIESHPAYNPKNPAELYCWGKRQADNALADTVAARKSYVLDGTMSDPSKAIRRMQDARAAGYHVVLITVDVPLELALSQNAKRERNVPVEVIEEKAATMPRAIAEAMRLADAGFYVQRTDAADPGTVEAF